MVDRDADFEITKLWRDRDVNRKPLNIARALTDGERVLVERRKRELEIGCSPFTPSEQDRAVKAISMMFGGNRSLSRVDDESAVAMANGLQHILRKFPLWAIEAGCELIHCGEAIIDGRKMDKRWAVNDAEVYAVVKEIVKPYQQALDNVAALLCAPVRDKEQARRA